MAKDDKADKPAVEAGTPAVEDPARYILVQKPVDEDETVEELPLPKYKLTEPAYIEQRLLNEGAQFYYTGKPGPHMKPLNDRAKAMVKAYPPGNLDPVKDLKVGPEQE